MDVGTPVRFETMQNNYQTTNVEGVVVNGSCAGTGVPVRRDAVVVTYNDGRPQQRTPIRETAASGYQCVDVRSLVELTRGR